MCPVPDSSTALPRRVKSGTEFPLFCLASAATLWREGTNTMNGELLRIVDSIHRDKNIDREIVFRGIETALLSAARKHFPETDEVTITIDRETGQIHASHNGDEIAPEVLGRIAAQTAKQIMIQKIREAERDALYEEFKGMVGQLVHGVVQRLEGGMVTVTIGKTEALLPRSEQIPGESYRPGERVRAIIVDVRKAPQRVKIVLSRTHPDFVRRLFEQEIPEIAEGIIQIKALAREAGYRTKVAVTSTDPKVDCVGACVGIRGTRIKNIVEELGGSERIDIVRWSDSLQEMIANALQPAQTEDVILFQMLGRAIVLVKEEHLSLAIGRRGQNVRLASKLANWDIEIMTAEELDEQIEKAVAAFQTIPGIDATVAERLVEHGFLSFDDLSIMGPDELAQVEGIDEQFAAQIIEHAEREAERLEREEAEAGGSTQRERGSLAAARQAAQQPEQQKQEEQPEPAVDEQPVEKQQEEERAEEAEPEEASLSEAAEQQAATGSEAQQPVQETEPEQEAEPVAQAAAEEPEEETEPAAQDVPDTEEHAQQTAHSEQQAAQEPADTGAEAADDVGANDSSSTDDALNISGQVSAEQISTQAHEAQDAGPGAHGTAEQDRHDVTATESVESTAGQESAQEADRGQGAATTGQVG